jgi:hypothetical protein
MVLVSYPEGRATIAALNSDRALGLILPTSILLSADEVIE